MGIKFPTPWKTLIIKFPPPRDGKGVKCPGYARGGGVLKLRFDRYISSVNDNQQPNGAEHQAWRSVQFKLKEGTMLFKHYKVQR